MHRRDFLRNSLMGLMASGLAPRLRADPEAGPPKACIILWMNGGPSHLDTWDPKPGTLVGGPFKAIDTPLRGVRICEHLPGLAEAMPRLALLRGMTSREGNHVRAHHLLHTGYAPNPTVQHAAWGSLVASELGDLAADLPAFVSLGGPSGDGGYLGVGFNPFVVANPSEPPQNVALGRTVDEARFQLRLQALEHLERGFQARTQDPKVSERQGLYVRAAKLMHSPHLKAFDLSGESPALREAYGPGAFGQGCLLARRLVEAGVSCVEVMLDGWDTHKDNFGRTKKLMGELDPAMSTLLQDLRDKGLLERTVVLWMGEFGRTPVLNGDEGRDHHPGAWSAVLAGGGIRGGQVVGRTDDTGTRVVDQPLQVADLFATLAQALGMDRNRTFLAPSGRPIRMVDATGKVIPGLLA